MNTRRVSYLVLGLVAVAVILFLTAGKVFSNKSKPISEAGLSSSSVTIDKGERDNLSVASTTGLSSSMVTIDKGERDNLSAASTTGLSSSLVTIDKGERDNLSAASTTGLSSSLVTIDKGERDSLSSAPIAVAGSDGSHYYEYGPASLATGLTSPAQENFSGVFPNVPWWH